jgi:hypothetical protein
MIGPSVSVGGSNSEIMVSQVCSYQKLPVPIPRVGVHPLALQAGVETRLAADRADDLAGAVFGVVAVR